LDNAATTQKPIQVIDAITDYYKNHNSNIHRAVHALAEESTEAFEATRGKVAKFLNVANNEEIIWARTPHFYYNFFVYQYATSFAA
jgi:cysteine desulfurase/selenocysteine lyase